MDMKQLTLRALEETIAYKQANPLPEKTLIDTGRDIPIIHGDITKLVEEVISIKRLTRVKHKCSTSCLCHIYYEEETSETRNYQDNFA